VCPIAASSNTASPCSPNAATGRYFGVLAPNASLRAAVTALVPGATTAPPAADPQPNADPLLQCTPAFEFDQRIAW
jgi:hypothetical protein